MKKIREMKMNDLLILGVLFLTIFLSMGGSVAAAISQGEVKYLLAGLLGWATQFLFTSVSMFVLFKVYKLVGRLFNKKK